MCIAFWLLEAYPRYKLLLALYRDEFHSRPTLPAHRWTDQPQIIGGRDVKDGGTWLAISDSGRLAFVTNFREPAQAQLGMLSRGQLPTLFLQSSKSPTDYLEEVAARASDYPGINLVVADITTGEMAYLSNRPRGQPIQVQQEIPEGRLVDEVLTDPTRAAISCLPRTGLAEREEYALSSIFVQWEKPPFGTRSMAVVAVHKTGKVTFYEDGVWKDHKLSFFVPLALEE